MSKFWSAAGGGSDSSSDGDESSDGSSSSYSSDEGSDQGGGAAGAGGGGTGGAAGGGANRWVAMSDSESSDDEVRVVKSGKDRALESFQAHIKKLRAHMKDRDYYAIQTEFDELAKSMVKARQYLADGVPRPLVKILVDLEDYITERLKDKEQFKKLSARQGRALNRMKLTLKKHNKAYQVVIDAYRKNPIVDAVSDDEGDAESKASSSSDSDSESSKSGSSSASSKSGKSSGSSGSSSKSSASGKSSKEDSDSESGTASDDEWGSDSSSSSSSDEEAGAYSQLKGRAQWLKKNTVAAEKVVKNKDERARARAEAKSRAEAEAKLAADAATATKSILPEEGLTASLLNRRTRELAAQRGRRGKDNRQLLRELEALYRLSTRFGPRVEVPILMYVVSAQYGLQRTLDDFMDTATWKSCASYLQRVADVLDEGYVLGVETIDESDLLLSGGAGGSSGLKKMKAAALASAGGAMAAVAADEKLVNPHTGEQETEDERAERLRLEAEAKMTPEEKRTIKVVGSLSLHLSRLEEEYTKSLQKISHHSSEYVVRLRDESKLVYLLTRFQGYFEKQKAYAEAAALAQLRIEHIYYRHDVIARQVDKAAIFYETWGEVTMLHPACIMANDSALKSGGVIHPAAARGKPSVEDPPLVDFQELMSQLCHAVYRYGTDHAKSRAMICQIYHHALHDRFVDARDLLLMSHLQETIYGCGDVGTMVLYNRMMVTLGMCAFRLGRIYDAHQCLSDVCSGRVRELLAQGMHGGRFGEKSAEQEKAEKRRQVPYHQHINLDLLEACHLISAMFLEVPNMAGALVDAELGSTRRPRVISRTFRKFIDQYNHQVFNGPPEQTRDFVMRAAKGLMQGDWKTCTDMVSTLDVWQLVPGEGAQKKIAAMLTEKSKLEGLRTYLFSFSAQYDSLSLSQLCAMFEMTKNEVHSVVSKMMINRELYASWDQPTETIVLRKVEPSSLQVLALQFAEKAAGLVEANERLLDIQSGSYVYKDDWKGGDGEERWQNRGGGYRRGGGGGGGGQYGRRTGHAGRGNRGRRNY